MLFIGVVEIVALPIFAALFDVPNVIDAIEIVPDDIVGTRPTAPITAISFDWLPGNVVPVPPEWLQFAVVVQAVVPPIQVYVVCANSLLPNSIDTTA